MGCYIVFDYYLSEIVCNLGDIDNYIIDLKVLLVVCVVYDYYGGVDKFFNILVNMMDVVDKGDFV